MTRSISLLITIFISLLFLVACENTAPTPTATNIDNTRAIEQTSQQVRFNGKIINLKTEDIIAPVGAMAAEGADVQALMNVNEAFLAAEKEAQALDVQFSMSEEPVDNGMFIFGIESPQAKNLTLEMFDEEGFEKVANNSFDITEGNNYKALNVESLDNGTYNFRIKDETGKELNRRIVIEQ